MQLSLKARLVFQLHLVHWNTKYGLFSKAVSEPDGLAVIGIFLELGEEDHPEMEKLTRHLKDIKYKNMRTSIEDEHIDPAKFLPGKQKNGIDLQNRLPRKLSIAHFETSLSDHLNFILYRGHDLLALPRLPDHAPPRRVRDVARAQDAHQDLQAAGEFQRAVDRFLLVG